MSCVFCHVVHVKAVVKHIVKVLSGIRKQDYDVLTVFVLNSGVPELCVFPVFPYPSLMLTASVNAPGYSEFFSSTSSESARLNSAVISFRSGSNATGALIRSSAVRITFSSPESSP